MHTVTLGSGYHLRYIVRWSPLWQHWLIVDREMKEYCGLEDQQPMLFETDTGARAWLAECYRRWGEQPLVGDPHPAPLAGG